MNILKTPEPPYYAVIFTSQHTNKEKEEVRDETGLGITSVY